MSLSCGVIGVEETKVNMRVIIAFVAASLSQSIVAPSLSHADSGGSGKYFVKSAAAGNYVEVIDESPENKSEVLLAAKDGRAN